MNCRRALTALVVLLLMAIPVTGQCAPASDQGGFWAQLKNKLEGFAPQKKATVTTAVGGVRGSKDKSADTLYWKGESTLQEIAEDELTAFQQACQSADAGDATKALGQFEEFIRIYPQSVLISDARQAINRLNEAIPATTPAAVNDAATTPAAAPATEPAAAAEPAPAAVAAPVDAPR